MVIGTYTCPRSKGASRPNPQFFGGSDPVTRRRDPENFSKLSFTAFGGSLSLEIFGQVAQMVEQWTENPCVGGSIPSLSTKSAALSEARRAEAKCVALFSVPSERVPTGVGTSESRDLPGLTGTG
jgi:hypothetical protein